ncbi:MAG: methyl-accepting chemotaxis protein [Campylobacterales bacterium]|nr:methyl-accepting chemotaxis protein [Campylobacterales bacterium]
MLKQPSLIKRMIDTIKVSPKAKIIMVIRVVLILSFLVLVFIIQNDITRYLIEENVDKAKKSVQQLQLTRETIDAEYTEEDVIRELHNDNFNFFADYIISNIAANMSKQHNITIKYLSDDNRNPQNRLHDDEKDIYNKLRSKNIKEYYEVDPKSDFIKYAKRINVERRCLKCHGQPLSDVNPYVHKKFVEKYGGEKGFGYKEGDMIGMVLVNVPIALAKETISQLGNTLLKSGAIIGILFAMLLIFLINRYFDNDIISPLERIANVLENYENDFTKTLPINKKNKELHTLATSFNQLVNRIKSFLVFFRVRIYDIADAIKEIQVVLDVLNSNLKKQLSLRSRLDQQLKTNEKLIEHIKHNRSNMPISLDDIELIKQEYTHSTYQSNLMLDRYIEQKKMLEEVLSSFQELLIKTQKGHAIKANEFYRIQNRLNTTFEFSHIQTIQKTIDENIANMMQMYEKINLLIRYNESKDEMINALLMEDQEILDIFEELNTNTQNSFKNFKDLSRLNYKAKDFLEEIALEIEHFKLK